MNDFGFTCPCCGQKTDRYIVPIYPLANFMLRKGKCPTCDKEQPVSPYNVKVNCQFCDFAGWRDDFFGENEA